MFTWAKEFRALVVFAEHRYYGESLPYGDASFYVRTKRDTIFEYLMYRSLLQRSNEREKALIRVIPKLPQGSERRGYLSTEQALADYAAILSHLKANHTGAAKSEIVVWGAGYSGMLAVWMRVKYPHLAKL